MKTTSKTKPNKTKARFRSPFTPSEQETHQAYSTASAASMGHHFCQALNGHNNRDVGNTKCILRLYRIQHSPSMPCTCSSRESPSRPSMTYRRRCIWSESSNSCTRLTTDSQTEQWWHTQRCCPQVNNVNC